MEEDNRKFVIYELLDINDIPFYVGRTGNIKFRMHDHNKNIRGTKNTYTYNKIRKMIKEHNYSLKYNIVFDNLTFEESINAEIELIKKYKESNIILTNLTAGGEGLYGITRIFTEEHKQNLRNAKKKLFDSGYVQQTKGKTYTEIYGEDKAKEKIENGRLKHKELINSGAKKTTKGKKLEEIVGIDKAVKLKQNMSIKAKNTFTGIQQSTEHIAARVKSQLETKQKWNADMKQHISNISRINGMKSKTRFNIKVILPDNTEFVLNTMYTELSEYLLHNYNIKCNPISISKILNNKLLSENTRHKCKFMLVQ